MKKILPFFAVLLLFTLSCCSSREEEIPEESLSERISSARYIISVKITRDKLEFDSDGVTYTFDGVTAQNDYADYSVVKEYLMKHQENGNFLLQDPVKLELHFTEEIPQSVKWNEYYYAPGSDSFLYATHRHISTEEDIDENTVLHVGLNKAVMLSSDIPPEKCYRIIRIVCGFESKTTEYYIFIDSMDNRISPEAADGAS